MYLNNQMRFTNDAFAFAAAFRGTRPDGAGINSGNWGNWLDTELLVEVMLLCSEKSPKPKHICINILLAI